ncbi:citrate/2-methylcitrate synthase [Arthrobacter sp. OV608]|uniref:citrate/2-methylcitrate synthase n=1 Tax=Arthrobacter sp. OV608 TaxID=1882768 RepID=UPI0008BE8085|nr:citrate/2-methylcitrate synthase [Arthrobacter sp. OV608]SER32065.1 citrate synthase/citryl-CoA lyase [Arthrobacter sp. OV608]
MASTTDDWSTNIAEVRDDDVLIRGRLLTSMIGKCSFGELAYLLISGRWPTKGQAHVLEAIMVSVMEHGISPTTTVTRMMASYGNPIQVGIAAGMLTIGDHHGGAGEQIAGWLREAIASVQSTGVDRRDEIRTKARSIVTERRAAREPIEGFGHPHHDVDPRAPLLIRIANEYGVYGDYCLLLESIEAELEAAVGRRIATNIDGVSAALLLDLGLDPRLARPILMAPRTLSLAAHFIEEQDQGQKWRHVPGSQVTYTGPQHLRTIE